MQVALVTLVTKFLLFPHGLRVFSLFVNVLPHFVCFQGLPPACPICLEQNLVTDDFSFHTHQPNNQHIRDHNHVSMPYGISPPKISFLMVCIVSSSANNDINRIAFFRNAYQGGSSFFLRMSYFFTKFGFSGLPAIISFSLSNDTG